MKNLMLFLNENKKSESDHL